MSFVRPISFRPAYVDEEDISKEDRLYRCKIEDGQKNKRFKKYEYSSFIPTNSRFDALKKNNTKRVPYEEHGMNISGYHTQQISQEIIRKIDKNEVCYNCNMDSISEEDYSEEEYEFYCKDKHEYMIRRSRVMYDRHCMNCGKQNHTYISCKLPITSIGIIAYRKEKDELKYLMIRRKYTFGYMDLVRGKYNMHNDHYMRNIVNEMTVDEKKQVLVEPFDKLWSEMWGPTGKQYTHEREQAKVKFELIKRGILVKGRYFKLEYFIAESNTEWKNAEFGFPKGRRNVNENDLEVGIREFCEESGYNPRDIHLIENLAPFEEVFMGSNYKSYKHCYFLAEIKNTRYKLMNFQESEVADIGWFSFEECIEMIRDYNIERKNILSRVHRILSACIKDL
jgi:8-oxo-dGTP pyrophosphatase MutT (NUDIX family)